MHHRTIRRAVALGTWWLVGATATYAWQSYATTCSNTYDLVLAVPIVEGDVTAAVGAALSVDALHLRVEYEGHLVRLSSEVEPEVDVVPWVANGTAASDAWEDAGDE